MISRSFPSGSGDENGSFQTVWRMREAWKWETRWGNRETCSVSVFFVRVGSQISPRRAKKDSNIPSPGRTRLVKCPTPGPTKTIKSPPHALPWSRVKLRYFDWPIPVFIGLVGAWQSKGVYFTVNYRIIANPSRKAHPFFLAQLCVKIRCMVCVTFNPLDTGKGEWQRYVTSLPLLSLPFSPSPPQEFYPHCLEQCVLLCCTSSSSTYTRLLQVFVSKFLFYYPYFILLLFCANLWWYSKH